MTIEYSYSELLHYEPTLAEKLSDFYWTNQLKADAALFFGVIALVVTMLVMLA